MKNFQEQINKLRKKVVPFLPPVIGIILPMLAFLLQLQAKGWAWFGEIPGLSEAVVDFTAVLAPFVAASLGIERLIEFVFDWFERSLSRVAEVIGLSKDKLDTAEKQYKDFYEGIFGTVPQSSTGLTTLDNAEKLLNKAEDALQRIKEHPQYVTWKRVISIGAGFSIGLTAAIWGDLTMMARAGIAIPRLLDMAITGLVIGAGPGPTHSVIGILQSGKETLDKLAGKEKRP